MKLHTSPVWQMRADSLQYHQEIVGLVQLLKVFGFADGQGMAGGHPPDPRLCGSCWGSVCPVVSHG